MDDSVVGLVVVAAVLLGWPAVAAIGNGILRLWETWRETRRKARLHDEEAAQLARLDAYRQELESYDQRLSRTQQELDRQRRELERTAEERLRRDEQKLARQQDELERIVREKSDGFPWLAGAFADYFELEGLKDAQQLAQKRHPAPVAAEKVREISRRRREVEADLRVAKYLLRYYENLFPWLVDFRGEDLDDLIRRKLAPDAKVEEETGDPAQRWLTDAEYKNLPTTKKYQLALDRYWSKKKSPWEIGRDYERYIGCLYEQDGFNVYYQGIVEGLADIGRDLVARKGRCVEVVQCKYWSREKTIHEKHIFQLFGTLTAYRVDHPEAEAKGKFVTSTTLSERAKLFATVLGVEYVESWPLQPYPCIKCNVSRRDAARIYHLPFDQQYDRTLIEEERLECYVATVEEAERLGFRRAFRWKWLGSGTESMGSGQAS
jgi:TolA-binding protein